MTANKIIIKFEQVADQSNDCIRRLIGFVPAKYLIDLISAIDLNANPRSAKKGNVTKDIIGSIQKTKEIFPFQTKGILLAVCTPPQELERKRYELIFMNEELEGILDGGHNTLAIALYMLGLAVDDESVVKKVKDWTDLKEVWPNYKDKIHDLRDQLDFLTPMEILCPVNDTEEARENFQRAIPDICTARNNNVQLPDDTKANQVGHYDAIKQSLDPVIAKDVIWKTNEEGRIPVRDIVTLGWIPLLKLKLPKTSDTDKDIVSVAPNQIYSSKGHCMEAFIKLMEHKEVSEKQTEGYRLINNTVASAFSLLRDIPELYDYIYSNFPTAYNKAGGKFGHILCVKPYNPDGYKENKLKYLRKQPTTYFYERPVDFLYPDGFIIPLVYGLISLICEKDGKLVWQTDPRAFLKKYFSEIVKTYKGVLEMATLDPQKVGKNAMSYMIAKQQFEHFLANPNVKAA